MERTQSLTDKIFVIVPVYNVERLLERCVDSILQQTYQLFDIILVDDGSTDRSSILCDDYAEKYTNITVIHQDNGGLSAARNTGIRWVKEHGEMGGSWICFIDSDDYIHPDYLKCLYQIAKESNTNISACSYLKTSEAQLDYSIISHCEYELMTPEKFWCKDRTLALIVVNKLYRLLCFQDVEFPLGKLHEDEFTTYKVLFCEQSVAVCWEQLYFYFFNPNSITHVEWKPNRLAGLDAYDEQLKYFDEHGYEKAYRASLAALCEHSIKHVKYIKVLSPKYDDLLKDVKKRRNAALKEYGKRYGFKNRFRIWYEFTWRNPIKKALGNENVFKFIKRQIKRRIRIFHN